MGGLVTLSLLLQDGVGEGAGDQSGAGTGAGGGILSLLPLFVILWFIVYVMMIRPQRKQQNQMLSSLKKNDLVRTSGGIYGKVVSVEPDRDLVVLKVDESNNVRLKVARSAIADVIDEKEKAPA